MSSDSEPSLTQPPVSPPGPAALLTLFCVLNNQIMSGHEECVQMLLEEEVSILCKDARGRTPLHYAAARGHATWLSELLQMALSEEDCSFKDNQGYTPLHWACYNGECDRVPWFPLNPAPLGPRGRENSMTMSASIPNLAASETPFFCFLSMFPFLATLMPQWDKN